MNYSQQKIRKCGKERRRSLDLSRPAQDLRRLATTAVQKDWVVYSKPPFGGLGVKFPGAT